MKKIFLTLVLCASVVVLSGCGKTQKEMSCSRTLNQSGIEMDLSYNVKYKGDYVTEIKMVEKITSDDKETLETYKTTLDTQMSPYKEIKYYDHEIKVDGKTLTSTTTINYEKINTDKLVEIDSSVKGLIKDGKVNVEDIETIYKTLGMTCEK